MVPDRQFTALDREEIIEESKEDYPDSKELSAHDIGSEKANVTFRLFRAPKKKKIIVRIYQAMNFKVSNTISYQPVLSWKLKLSKTERIPTPRTKIRIKFSLKIFREMIVKLSNIWGKRLSPSHIVIIKSMKKTM